VFVGVDVELSVSQPDGSVFADCAAVPDCGAGVTGDSGVAVPGGPATLGDDTEAVFVGELVELELLEDAVDFGNDVPVNGSENGRPESGVGPLNKEGIGVGS
jgi:hypothetical protein